MINDPFEPKASNKLGTITMLGLAVVLIFIGVKKTPAAYGSTPTRYPVLAACTRFEYNLFRDYDFTLFTAPSAIEQSGGDVYHWRRDFHNTVRNVVDEHMLGSSNCLASTHAQSYSPRAALTELALKLPTWRPLTWQIDNEQHLTNWWDIFDPNIPIIWEQVNENYTYLSQIDVGTVLLEYLRMYECALIERSVFLASHTVMQEGRRNAAMGIGNPWIFQLMLVANRAVTDRRIIMEELVIARRAIHRTVTFLSGYNRLSLIGMEMQCMQQGSMDFRNSMSLAATASSCMPRLLYHKDVLRDY